MESAFANLTVAGYTPGLANMPLASRAANAGFAAGGDVEHFEFGPRDDAFGVRAASKRPALPGGGLRLHLENPFDDLIDASVLRLEVPLLVAESHPEPPRHGQHGELLDLTHARRGAKAFEMATFRGPR